MEPILRTIAREYSQRYSNLKDLCFLFPNKRCSVFLRKYFAEFDIHTEDLPHILTISEFMSIAAKQTEAGRIEQIFTLYNSYLELLSGLKEVKDATVEFEAFRNWGEIVLADFNTVDMSLCDPDELFRNVKDYREIATDFLSDEQKEVMKEYFGVTEFGESERFWKQFDKDSKKSPLKERFLNLWQLLAPLHRLFINKLREKGLGTTGSIYREAAKNIEIRGKQAFPIYKKVVAVGFNALTEAERKVFSILQDEKGFDGYDAFIDFVWDASGPILSDSNFTASRFVDYNKKHLPMPDWMEKVLEKQENADYPQIEIISSPSLTAQAKVAGQILEEYKSGEGKEMIMNSEVALVLPDETLLTNVLYSLPDGLDEVNLTMGLSMRQTSIVAFISLLRRVYANMRESKKGNYFLSKDLKLLFTNPYAYILWEAEEVENALKYISDYHKISLTLDEIAEFIPTANEFLSFPSKKDASRIESSQAIFELLKKILDTLESKLEEIGENIGENSGEEKEYVKIYKEYLDDFEETLKQFGITLSPLSVMTMGERLISGSKIGFEGEPLVGLQVMGTLETRSLDFKHVIILSMNEGIMPRRSVSSTFIPESLRRAYGLPPARYAEEIFGYYFYRLISRAEKVTLIYDGRVISGMRNGESRYLLQLREYAPKDKMTEVSWQYHLQSREREKIVVERDPEIRRLYDKFSSLDKDSKNLSASSLNTYRDCELKFFLKCVLNINDEKGRDDYMDPITLGNIFHEVMMDLYLPPMERNKFLDPPKILTATHLQNILDNKDQIKELVDRKIRKFYYGDKEGKGRVVESGVLDMLSQQIEELVREVVNHDLTLAPILLYGCEITKKFQVELSSGRKLNFKFAIDRLDEVEIDGVRRLRVIDYKTGSVKLDAKNLEEIFSNGGHHQVFQLFMYSWLLNKMGAKRWQGLQTEIYSVPLINMGKRGLPILGKDLVEAYGPYHEDFNRELEELLENLFENPEIKGTPNKENCKFCGFNDLCGKA